MHEIMSVIFLGESIHGVAEFTLFKREWLARHESDELVIVFEADHIGILRSRQEEESPEEILLNFPRVHRTCEMLALLEFAVANKIPFYGADVVSRNQNENFALTFQSHRHNQKLEENRIYALSDPFPARDEYMCDVMWKVAQKHPKRTIIGFFHNLHIKKQGSLERDEFYLPSVAEQLFKKYGLPSYSIGLFARSGRALHNNLSEFTFSIADSDVVEALADSTHVRALKQSALGERSAYHHAFEKENLPVRIQYDECIVFDRVTTPTLFISKTPNQTLHADSPRGLFFQRFHD